MAWSISTIEGYDTMVMEALAGKGHVDCSALLLSVAKLASTLAGSGLGIRLTKIVLALNKGGYSYVEW